MTSLLIFAVDLVLAYAITVGLMRLGELAGRLLGRGGPDGPGGWGDWRRPPKAPPPRPHSTPAHRRGPAGSPSAGRPRVRS